VLDFTGLAQKNGAVMSHVRLAPKPGGSATPCASPPAAPTWCWAATWSWPAAPAALSRIEPGITKAVINGYMTPVAAFVMNGDMDLGAEAMMKSIRDAAGNDATTFVDGTGPRHGDHGRFDRHQPLHAGLCLAERAWCRCRSTRSSAPSS
jgi:indolepyruvate ferredoxin oxidoreductase